MIHISFLFINMDHQSPSLFTSTHATGAEATHNSEKEKLRGLLDIDLNRPLDPQMVEDGAIQIKQNQITEGGLIFVEKNQGGDLRGFDGVEASTSSVGVTKPLN
ncbi:hypothetical protein EZV62_013153 [Acer yangbiense]|uniref:Uncharacterized protein n=1 Tax=Acer yangbiense TaxID=1000413 RepID=A0A5C7HY18_9ROSI|nr:hypothetical protein EZV62_013153 [Acer yangbiense]